MNFYRTPHGKLINLDLVRAIELDGYEREKPERTGKFFTVVKFIFDDEHHISEKIEHTVDAVEERLPAMSATIPAPPGFHSVSINWNHHPGPDPWVGKEPIIGWQIRYDGNLFPVCLDGYDARQAIGQYDGHGAYGAILYPDGRVRTADGDVFDTLGSWIDSCRKLVLKGKATEGNAEDAA